MTIRVDYAAGEKLPAADVNEMNTLLLESPPTGSITMYGASSAPAGWLVCDGSGLDTTTYADLFAIIGYTYGGTGSTFNLPNLKGKVPVGYNSADTDFDAMGETGGEKEHTLTTAEMPSHTHREQFKFGGLQGGNEGPGPVTNPSGTNTTNGLFTNPTGSGNSHNNLQPYIALQFIIKY